jgi:hypothetical protein
MDTNLYRQKLTDKILSEMNNKRALDNDGLKHFVKITAETLQKNNTKNLDEALLQITNFAFNIGFNEGLKHSLELLNKI